MGWFKRRSRGISSSEAASAPHVATGPGAPAAPSTGPQAPAESEQARAATIARVLSATAPVARPDAAAATATSVRTPMPAATDVHISRQPIFDRSQRVTGYELICRDAAMSYGGEDPAAATAQVVLSSLTEIGLAEMVGGRGAWLHVSPEFISRGMEQLLPAGSVLEITNPDPCDYELSELLTALKRRGGHVAFDDFRFTPESEVLMRLADVIRLDLVELGRERFHEELKHAEFFGIPVLADRVENRKDYEFCKREGAQFFQGYFFRRPEISSAQRIDGNRAALLDLLGALNDPSVEMADLEAKISLDVGLSTRLLRYLNSAYFGLQQPVRSLGQAMALLGLERLRRWCQLTLFASLSDKPTELTVNALVRARFCELAAPRLSYASSGDAFTAGLLSVVDALLDVPIAEAVDSIRLAADIRLGVVRHEGALGQMLECIEALEAADFERAEEQIPGAALVYRSAVEWTDEAAQSLLAA